jgi:hypothetical protein
MAIWVESLTGFSRDVRCGALWPGKTAALLNYPASVPRKTTITWRKRDSTPEWDEVRTFVVNLGSIQPAQPTDFLVFEFLPNETWVARYEPSSF